MPHDLKGVVVEVGQEVTMRFRVTAVQQGTDYCNATLESVQPMYPGEHKSPLTVNTKQVEVIKSADWRESEKKEVSA